MSLERQRKKAAEIISAFKKVIDYLQKHPEIDAGIPKASMGKYAAIIAASNSGSPGFHLGAISDQAVKDWRASSPQTKQDATNFMLKELSEVSRELALKQLQDFCPLAFVAAPKAKSAPAAAMAPRAVNSTGQLISELKASSPLQTSLKYHWNKAEGQQILNALIEVIGTGLTDKQHQVNDKDRDNLHDLLRTIAKEGKQPDYCITQISHQAMKLCDYNNTPTLPQRIYTALKDMLFDNTKDVSETLYRINTIPSRSKSTPTTPRSEMSDTESSESKSAPTTPRPK